MPTWSSWRSTAAAARTARSRTCWRWSAFVTPGAGPLGSGVALDKDLSKRLFLEAEVLTAAWLMAPVTVAAVDLELDWPVVVKPSRQGSTVGLSVVRDAAGLAAAIAEAARYDDEVMVEAFVPGGS